MMKCPKCGRTTAAGRFCERCGAELPQCGAEVPQVDRSGGWCAPAHDGRAEQNEPSQGDSPTIKLSAVSFRDLHVGQSSHPSFDLHTSTPAVQPRDCKLEIDTLCLLFEGLSGFLRFRVNLGAVAENVLIVLENPLTGDKVQSRNVVYLQGIREIIVPVPAQMAGAFVWYATVFYEAAGRKHRFEGEVQMLVVRPREAQKAADQLSVTITNNINNGNASDVHVSQRAVEELAHLAQAENPFEELRRIVLGGKRVWALVTLDAGGAMPTLPSQPIASVRETITLDIGTLTLHFFSNRTIRLGRRREVNEIALRPPEGASDERYRAVSRAQCYFGHQGDKVVVRDGQVDDLHVARPSSYGTYWNDSRIVSDLVISAGESGVISLSGTASSGAVSLDAKACRPIHACATCPHANRTWCGDGRRPTFMLTRRDGVAERFVALWSCFSLEEADPSFEGVVIFRKNGGFAWRRGRRCGWLVPGEILDTDCGQVKIS